jgi:hypothetical protein
MVKLEEIKKENLSFSIQLKAYDQFGSCDSTKVIFNHEGYKLDYNEANFIINPDVFNIQQKK